MQNNENTNTPDLPEFILPVRLRALTHPSALAGKVDEKATQLHAIASLKVLLDATKPQNGAATSSAANHVSAAAAKQETMLAPSSIADMPNGVANALTDVNLEAVSCQILTLHFLHKEHARASTRTRGRRRRRMRGRNRTVCVECFSGAAREKDKNIYILQNGRV